MVIYYKNSFLASLVSILGCAIALVGITAIPEGEILGAVICIPIGVAMVIWARKISQDKAFKKWWKQIADNDLEPQIAASVSFAVQVYNKNPQKRTLGKIRALNPAAAAHIEQSLAAQKK